MQSYPQFFHKHNHMAYSRLDKPDDAKRYFKYNLSVKRNEEPKFYNPLRDTNNLKTGKARLTKFKDSVKNQRSYQ